jgi:hypothetical protein
MKAGISMAQYIERQVLGYKGKSGALLYHRARLFSPIQQEMPRPLPSMKHQISFDDYG